MQIKLEEYYILGMNTKCIFPIMEQFLLAVLGGLSVWLVACKGKIKKWGYVLGLVSAPLWLHTSFIHKQWGIFVLSIWYAIAWGWGIYNYWIKKD